ncbi:MAG: glycogen synthase [Clostridia bacterium]|nr:glycogen synthase [Oscillospiraceae bacterium]MBQ3763279.1 glycogen synthase [Clostridia bacterium]
MKIAMVASEAAPFVKTGGLGDVMQALPAELAKIKGNEICLFLPYYKKIKQNPGIEVESVGSFSMELSWRESYVGIFRLKSRRKKLQVYFIDNDYYFGARGSVYGDFDDGERFAYYSKAVMAALYYLDFKPDILHCHDWQSAMALVYCRALYGQWCPYTKTVFTIHNVEYQGWADAGFFENTLGLPAEYLGHLTFDGAINMMKGAIEVADIVTTVSKTYAEELRYPYYAHRLDGVLREKWLWGITNGIDTTVYNPETDPALKQNYSAKNMKGKWDNKLELRKELGLRTDTDAPILAMVSRLAGHKGIDLLCYIANRLMEREIQLVIVGTGEKQYEYALSSIAKQHPGKVSVQLAFDPALASRVYAGADMYLMPSKSEPCGLSQLIAMHYGTVPVVASTGGLRDTVLPYNGETGEGRGFTFQSYNADDFLGAIDRAVGLYYNDRDRWNALAKHDMEIDFSWRVPAAEYMQLYTELRNK